MKDLVRVERMLVVAMVEVMVLVESVKEKVVVGWWEKVEGKGMEMVERWKKIVIAWWETVVMELVERMDLELLLVVAMVEVMVKIVNLV